MATDLDPDDDELPRVDSWPASDSRQLLFTVTQGDDSPKDVTSDDVEWELLDKPYDDRSEAVLDDTDDGVTVERDTVVDPAEGEFRVDIAEGTLDGEWGRLFQRVTVDPPGDSRLSWIGEVILRADGTTA